MATVLACALGAQPQPANEEASNRPQKSGLKERRQETYRIHAGDKLSIRFPYQPEFNEPEVVVRPDGHIALAMIDEVMAKGLTVEELKAAIEKAYSQRLRSPVVSINLIEFVAPRVYVGGQVGKPGSYELRESQTLTQAVFLAGGFTRDANRRLVLHARPDESGKLRMRTVDVIQMLTNPKAAEEIMLQDGDYIFVPDSKASKVSRVMESFRAAIPSLGMGIGYR